MGYIAKVTKLACISVNLLGFPHLCRRYGIDERGLPPAGASAVTRRAPERFAELFDRHGIHGTFFAVGEDLEDGPSAMAVHEVAKLGHEVASHGWSGDPRLGLDWPAAVPADIHRGAEAIEALVGKRPVGFRSPGQTIGPEVLAALEDQGFAYDASVYPSLPGWVARAALQRYHRDRARQDRPDSPAMLLAPREPYRPHRRDPYRRGSAHLVEIPIATVPVSRLPFTGTLLLSSPRKVAAALYRAVRFRDFLGIRLNGWDLLDDTDGAHLALAERRRDLAIPSATKWQRLGELLSWIRHDFEVVTYEEAAGRLAGEV